MKESKAMKPHYKTIKKIFKEMGGSLFRLNNPSSEYYEFTLIKEGKHILWEGGFYNGREARYFEHVLDLNTGKLLIDIKL